MSIKLIPSTLPPLTEESGTGGRPGTRHGRRGLGGHPRLDASLYQVYAKNIKYSKQPTTNYETDVISIHWTVHL